LSTADLPAIVDLPIYRRLSTADLPAVVGCRFTGGCRLQIYRRLVAAGQRRIGPAAWGARLRRHSPSGDEPALTNESAITCDSAITYESTITNQSAITNPILSHQSIINHQ
jgi:hypothetical protein